MLIGLGGFWAAGPPKVPFPILIGTTLTTVLHYRADCDYTMPSFTPQPQSITALWLVLILPSRGG